VWWLGAGICITWIWSRAGDPSCALDPWCRGGARERLRLGGSSGVQRGTPSAVCRAGVMTAAVAPSKPKGQQGGAQEALRQCGGGEWQVWEVWSWWATIACRLCSLGTGW